MPGESFDTIVVGARCAGAPLATHLAKAGQRVLVLDGDRLPSDQPFSTHNVQPRGMRYLEELGVADAIRKVTPAVTHARFTVNGHHIDLALEHLDMRVPRRTTLDTLLQFAAVDAGAELRSETTVLDVIEKSGRVVGVKARRNGLTEELRARVVVGADGRNSTIARKVHADEYLVSTDSRVGYWNYWPTPRIWHTDGRWPYQVTACVDGDTFRPIFETDGDLLLMGVLAPYSRARTWRRDPDAALARELGAHPMTAPLIAGQKPIGRAVGLLKGRFYFRRAAGPGWALVGDAGLHKDPTPGLGITDALRDAKSLSTAILDGRESALELYWRERDVLSMPLYWSAGDMGSTDYANPFMELVFDRLNASPTLKARMRRVFDREMSPYEMVPAKDILKWTTGALLRGRTEILPAMLKGGRRVAELGLEMRYRRQLFEKARDRAGSSRSSLPG